MAHQAAYKTSFTAHQIRQAIKWTVYTLLIINFVFYILEDWTRWIAHVVHGARLFCYVLLAHTVYTFLIVVMNLQPTVEVENVSNLCDLANSNVSYVYNLEYTVVNDETCGALAVESQFYWLAEGSIVTDLAGLQLERGLAWVDLVEVITWLLIVLSIEIVVRLQGRSISGGAIISTANTLKPFLYMLLIGLSLYWASLSHWFYVWDELVWICGFAAIEMNIGEWRNELLGKQEET